MRLDHWLEQVYADEVEKDASDTSEFDQMSMEELLDIVTEKTASVAPSQAKDAGWSLSLPFMDKVARQIARQHAELAKEGSLPVPIPSKRGFVKQDEFTSPESQAKAKIMQNAMKATKNAPPAIRKGAVKSVARQLQNKTAGARRVARVMSAIAKKRGEPQMKAWSAGERAVGKLDRSLLRRGQAGGTEPTLGRTLAHATPKQQGRIKQFLEYRQ